MVGRKKMYGLELILIIFATLAQSLSADAPALTIVGVVIFWRVLMGIGIGGGTYKLHLDSLDVSTDMDRLPAILDHYI